MARKILEKIYDFGKIEALQIFWGKSYNNRCGKIGHIDHPRSFWRDHAFPAAKDHPKLTSFFASFLS
jgi:hypothetical protein